MIKLENLRLFESTKNNINKKIYNAELGEWWRDHWQKREDESAT